jgi:hypothetical protein
MNNLYHQPLAPLYVQKHFLLIKSQKHSYLFSRPSLFLFFLLLFYDPDYFIGVDSFKFCPICGKEAVFYWKDPAYIAKQFELFVFPSSFFISFSVSIAIC